MFLTKGTYIADRYEVLEKIGAGGMSDVYKAKDHILGREVAVKVLKQEFAEDITFVTKFRSEAQSAAGLEHPNIVNIYDVGSENNMYYIVMEYVEGITLKTYVEKKGRLNFKEALSIAIQVGRGIEAAHKKNIVHRDIKPQNIMISTEGKVKVTDFGIARAATSNTIHADVMGSVHYSSPEQARNGFVDFKSDIYSLGIMMYEMVTGRVPFDGDTTVAVALQHLQEEMVHPSAYVSDLPISLEKIILKATMKSPDRRYASMEDLLMDLKKALVSPNEDFVTLYDGDEGEKTKVITPAEQEQIARELEAAEGEYDEDDDEEEEDDGPVNPKMDKAITIMGIAAAVVILAIIIYLVGSVMGLFKFKSPSDKDDANQETEQVEMIDLLGMTEKEARAALKEQELDLGIKVTKTASSDEYEEGQIMEQAVSKGDMVDINTTIEVTVSTGKGDIAVPSVTGKDESAAKNLIEDAGFEFKRDYEYSNTVPSGQVISQNPVSGSQAKKGDTITVVVSQGTQSVRVPDVRNKTRDEAHWELAAAGLNLGTVTTEFSDTVGEGKVISQGVSPGKFVDSGTSVSLVISKVFYKYSYTVEVPEGSTVQVEVRDANGRTVYDPTTLDKTTTISPSGITTPTGTLYLDGVPQSVSFTRQ